MSSLPTVRFLDRTTPPHIATLILLAGISALNMSIFLPSLNIMAQDFGTDYATIQFAVSGYLAATAVLQIAIGPLSDRFGRRAVVLAALMIFVLASAGAALAPTIGTFLVFRILQAAVATGIVLSRAIVRDIVPQDQAASMIGYVTMGMALVPMLGPMVGGALDEAFGWRSTLVFLAVAGTGVLALCYFDQGETLSEGGMGFREQVAAYPVLLTSPRFWGYSLAAAFGSGAFFAYLGGAPFVANGLYGLSPLWTGIALGAPAAGYAFGNYLSGRFTVRVGVNTMAMIGTLITLAGLGVSLLLALAGSESAWLFFGFCTIFGMGNGMLLPGAMAGSMSVRPRLAGTASGLSGALMIGGGAALSQLAGVVLEGQSSAIPLQVLMFACAVLSLLAVIFVIFRGRQVATA
ncbi:multidrug effflux MFS transporter [Yoonia sp. R2331]|uniref:multidrug effflux MFS transporter n=1 Tax=Yoonia sp. R2331 TaxID=3237238 RepID=UPI0034E5C91D